MPAKDLRGLHGAVRNIHWNTNSEVILLCDYLVESITANRPVAHAYEKEKIWTALFPNKKYDGKQLRYLMSWLLDVVRHYLISTEVGTDSITGRLLLCHALRHRGMNDWLEKEERETAWLLEKHHRHDARSHHHRYLLHQSQNDRTTNMQRSEGIDYQPLVDELTTYFAAEILRYACASRVHEMLTLRSYNFSLLPAVLEAVESGVFSDSPAVQLFFHTYRTLEGSETHFATLRELMDEHWERFDTNEIRGIYLLAINFCIKKMNAGVSLYIREAFDLYRTALERDLLNEGGYLTNSTFKNIIRVATALGETAWAEDFLTRHKSLLHPRERENTWRYNRAFFYFQQADYAQVLPLLQTVELNDRLNNLDARRMLLRSYYELGEFQALDSLLDSFGTYIRRQKDLGYHRENYLNLIRFVKKLLNINRLDKKVMAALHAEISETQLVAEKKWLLEKCR